MEKTEYGLILLSLVGFVVAIILYPLFPDQMVSHWDVNGNPDGYMSKNVSLFLFPAIIVIMTLLLIFLPNLDPKKKNYRFFKRAYYLVILAFELFFYLIYAMFLLWNLGYRLPTTIIFGAGIGMLFIVLGYLLKEAKQNWFVGIRTPWTLENEEVWNKTHKLGSILFYVVGVVIVLTSFIPPFYQFIVIIAGVSIVTIVLVVYSYVEFKKLGARSQQI